jgi:tRNA(fMet)-specific endonuclease VapC
VSYLLDTNICSAHFRRAATLAHKFIQHSGRLSTSAVVVAELLSGAYLRSNSAPILNAISELLDDVTVLSFDAHCADQYGRLIAQLRSRGITVSALDLMIASTALVHDLTLVTHNTADFQNIPGLRLEDWLVP